MANDFFKDLSETITKTAQGLSERVGGLYEEQKLRARISDEEKMVTKTMADIGQIMFDRYLAGNVEDEELTSLFEEIKEHMANIEDLKAESAGKKNQKICPNCKKAVDKTVCFCPFCGTEVPNPEPVEEEAEEIFEEAADAGEELTEQAGEVAEEVKEEVQEQVEAVRETLEDAIDSVTED